jgi:hypothetical protein
LFCFGDFGAENIRSLYVLGSVLLVVQLSLVCGIFQQPAMSASPGPKPF